MAPSKPDLRALLAAADPRDFQTKKAWQEVIRGLRRRRRETGEAPRLRAWADVERALATVPLTDDVGELKRLLRAMVKEDGGAEVAHRVDLLTEQVLPAFAEGEIRVDVDGFPDGFDALLQARLLRRGTAPPLDVDAPVAAALVREFDGFSIAGSRLRVRAHTREGEILPPVPRELRSKPMRRGRTGPWLPHTDEVGLRSLTPRALAERQVERFGVDRVIDGFCGLGGNAIAFAEAGVEVIAVERDPARLELARANAGTLPIDFRLGDVHALLPSLPRWPRFFDPPWDAIDLGGLLDPTIPTMLNLPREFDVSALGDGWTVHYEFGAGADDHAVVRMLSVVR